jgi:ABC-type nitrate/sulfonate/bicarbonate transport system substrate-binding protein
MSRSTRSIRSRGDRSYRPRSHRVVIAALCTVFALLAASCGDDADPEVASGPDATVVAPPVLAGEPFPESRCEQNRAAGEILFLTSFDYAAAASIIDVVTADEQGYFEAMCLDVKLQAGFSSDNVAIVAAGRAQMTSLGSFSEVAVANAQGAELVAIAVEGKTSIETLLVEEGTGITRLEQLEGRTMGIKGAIPYSLRAMLAKAGVDESSIRQIEVGFNPVTLFETELEALPVYKSNEPGQLDAQGYGGRYRSFDPADFDIPASFAVFTTSAQFAAQHPTAVADFLRAALKGFEWAAANPEAAVDATLARSDPQLFFSPEGEIFRWRTESRLVAESTPPGQPVGAIDLSALEEEVAILVDLGVIEPDTVDVAGSVNSAFIDAVTDGETVIWPAG